MPWPGERECIKLCIASVLEEIPFALLLGHTYLSISNPLKTNKTSKKTKTKQDETKHIRGRRVE